MHTAHTSESVDICQSYLADLAKGRKDTQGAGAQLITNTTRGNTNLACNGSAERVGDVPVREGCRNKCASEQSFLRNRRQTAQPDEVCSCQGSQHLALGTTACYLQAYCCMVFM